MSPYSEPAKRGTLFARVFFFWEEGGQSHSTPTKRGKSKAATQETDGSVGRGSMRCKKSGPPGDVYLLERRLIPLFEQRSMGNLFCPRNRTPPRGKGDMFSQEGCFISGGHFLWEGCTGGRPGSDALQRAALNFTMAVAMDSQQQVRAAPVWISESHLTPPK